MRKVMVVAMARRLLIALWRYATARAWYQRAAVLRPMA